MPQIALTTDQLNTLSQAERILHDLLPTIDGLEVCDYNCQALRDENDRIRQLITNMKSQFGNGVSYTGDQCPPTQPQPQQPCPDIQRDPPLPGKCWKCINGKWQMIPGVAGPDGLCLSTG